VTKVSKVHGSGLSQQAQDRWSPVINISIVLASKFNMTVLGWPMYLNGKLEPKVWNRKRGA
jgi:hypothetical protein